jgi:hypothetical protein
MADTISDVSYDYDEKFLALGKTFFNLDDISTAKTGMFGYTTVSHSHIAKDAAFHRNALFSEYFLNTASMKSSLFNWSRVLDYDLDLAKPAGMKVALRFDTQRLMTVAARDGVGTVADGYRIFRLTKDQIFSAGGFEFLLPYEVEFRVRFDGTVPSVFARYDMSTVSTNYADPTVTNENLRVLVEGTQAVIYFNLHQLKRQTLTFDVLNNDILERSIYDVAFGGNLVSFRLEYQEPADRAADRNVWNDVVVYFGDRDGVTDPRYAFYTLADEQTLRVYFSTKLGSFNPEFNSRLRVEYVTTDGSAGNFSYTGNVFLKESFLEQIGYSVVNLTDPAGGSDQISFRETKTALMDKLRTRDSYITESDLEKLFLAIRKTRIGKNIETKVVRVRDDFFRRVFSVYTLLRLKDGSVVPSTTASLRIPYEQLSAMGFSLRPGTVVVYDRDIGRYRLLAAGEIPDPYIYSKESYVFVVPYLINVDFKEFPKTNVYLTDYERSIAVDYVPVSATSGAVGTININSYTVSRNTLVDLDRFHMAVDVITSGRTMDGLTVVAKLFKGNTLIGVAPMTQDTSGSRYTLDVLTDDAFSSEGEYLIRDTFYDPTDLSKLQAETRLVGKYRIDIGVYSSPYTGGTQTPVIEFKANEEMGIAEDVTPFVQLPVVLRADAAQLTLDRVPLVSGAFFFHNNYHADIVDTLSKMFQVLDETDVRLENGTQIDLKFYNTAGVSRNYDVDNTDLRVRFQIKLKGAYDRDLDAKIRKDVVDFVEASNYTLDRRFSISNLITKLERKYSEISYIQVFTINGANIQSVAALTDIDEKKFDYVPEFLTVRKNPGDNGDGKDYTYAVQIDYLS